VITWGPEVDALQIIVSREKVGVESLLKSSYTIHYVAIQRRLGQTK
jgi:hypothetical protein